MTMSMVRARHQRARVRQRIRADDDRAAAAFTCGNVLGGKAVSTFGLSPGVDMRSHVVTVAALAAEADDAARVDLPCSIRATGKAQPVGGLQDESTHPLAGVAADRAG